MDTGRALAVVGLGGMAVYFLFIRRSPTTGLALADELLAPRMLNAGPGTNTLPQTMPGNTSMYGGAQPVSAKTAAIGAIGAGSAAVASMFAAGGTTAAAGAGAAAAATGGAGAGTAAGVAGGIGTAGTIAITGGIAGGALLTWAIWKKGLFRGGEEALHVNPDRDQFLAQEPISSRPDGTDGSAWTKTNSWKLAAQLVEWGHPDGGGPLYEALQKADTVAAFTTAARAVQAEYARHGIYLQAP